MPTSVAAQRDLITGLPMTLPEFLETWADLPEVQHAELIDGIVHVPRPRSALHFRLLTRVLAWLGEYATREGGVHIGSDETWQMLGFAPQPCAHLHLTGAPELILELCETNTEVDFGPKLALYQRH